MNPLYHHIEVQNQDIIKTKTERAFFSFIHHLYTPYTHVMSTTELFRYSFCLPLHGFCALMSIVLRIESIENVARACVMELHTSSLKCRIILDTCLK